ncbi:DUF2897 domain-containing protein [Vibrio sp. S17_S38]|uniref:DUF2897 domain-containing protein n=1 Tax=Vibrio sp. S17_S38 TaxID=2720229 RepID=UPI00168010E1|nr:DUF2897 domain-containing protein [Vibrio sp. S17_S38]MBD1571897.1 DUF2897 domain-containing protein [Vibrio sp. S17_S38]
MDLLLNPWVISILIIVFIIGNIASIKYLGTTHLARKNPNKKTELEKLIETYKVKDEDEQDKANNESSPESNDKENHK